MPEGDTIHRTAAALRAALAGRELRRVELPRHPPPLPRVGATITGVEARGKHVLVHADDGLTVHTHLGMQGAWHLVADGARPSYRGTARVVLGVEGLTARCVAAPVVEVLDRDALRRHPRLRRLGPDLCEPQVDLDEVLARLERLVPDDRTVGEALLDQRVASGIGNVYRCEVLFLHGLDPATPLAAVGHEGRRALWATAAELLRANLDTPARTTVPGAPRGGLWVYGRAGRPCRRCGSTIVRTRLGDPARVVDACPGCQVAGCGDNLCSRNRPEVPWGP